MTCIFLITPAVVLCDPLSDPTNGMVTVEDRTVDSVAIYECDTGYELNGDETRTCEDDGEWSGSEPTCERMLLLTSL